MWGEWAAVIEEAVVVAAGAAVVEAAVVKAAAAVVEYSTNGANK